ncbi:hypothetical protein C0J45_8793 [Silurus meridionalis]|nr:hypothetical protein C0J45_8793 [Silurus meridionalis]
MAKGSQKAKIVTKIKISKEEKVIMFFRNMNRCLDSGLAIFTLMNKRQAYQTDLMQELDEGFNSGADEKLRCAAELTLRATKETGLLGKQIQLQGISLVVLKGSVASLEGLAPRSDFLGRGGGQAPLSRAPSNHVEISLEIRCGWRRPAASQEALMAARHYSSRSGWVAMFSNSHLVLPVLLVTTCFHSRTTAKELPVRDSPATPPSAAVRDFPATATSVAVRDSPAMPPSVAVRDAPCHAPLSSCHGSSLSRACLKRLTAVARYGSDYIDSCSRVTGCRFLNVMLVISRGCSTASIPRWFRFPTPFRGGLLLAIGGVNVNVPETCCFCYHNNPIPIRVITGYKVTDRHCSKPAVIFTLKSSHQDKFLP